MQGWAPSLRSSAVAVIRRRAFVSGRVQGVFYRAAAEREAARLGVSGWARNLNDGRVELVAEGEPAAVEAFLRWAWRGSSRSTVTAVDVAEEAPEGLTAFRSA